MYTLIHTAALDDPHKQCMQNGTIELCALGAFEDSVIAMRDFITTRAAFVKNVIARQGYQAPASAPAIRAVTVDRVAGTARIAGENFSVTPRSFVAVEGVRAKILAISPTEAVIRLPPDLPSGLAAFAVAADGALGNTMEVLIPAP